LELAEPAGSQAGRPAQRAAPPPPRDKDHAEDDIPF
jgi:hypothetical protein